jgi:hypothetical protein
MLRALWPVVVILAAAAPLGHAEEAAPWQDPEVIQAAWEIGLSPEQQASFRDIVTEFLEGYGSDVQRLLNSNNPTDLPRKISSKRRIRVKAMDEQMAALLSREQQTAYGTYRDLLLQKMDEAAARRRRR